MGCCYRNPPAPPCANCGKEDAGRMIGGAWSHNQPCCSDACGKRLGHKIRHGMLIQKPDEDEWYWPTDADRIANLRIEIKLLRHRLAARRSHP